jgi:lipoyl-dependent peroxiredoxin
MFELGSPLVEVRLLYLRSEEGHPPDSVRARAKVHLRNVDGLPTIARIELEVEGSVPGLDEDGFRGLAEKAKAGCPVSRALAGVPEIELSAGLA